MGRIRAGPKQIWDRLDKSPLNSIWALPGPDCQLLKPGLFSLLKFIIISIAQFILVKLSLMKHTVELQFRLFGHDRFGFVNLIFSIFGYFLLDFEIG